MYKVTIQNTGDEFDVEPGETLLAAGKRQGVKIPYGCDEGGCGVCMSRIVAGTLNYPDGRPMALFKEDEAAGMCLCCSGVPTSDMVIELAEQEDWEPWG